MKFILALIFICSISHAMQEAAPVRIYKQESVKFQDRGRRDPFTFMRVLSDADKDTIITPPVEKPDFDVRANMAKVQAELSRAESCFIAAEFEESLKSCDAGLKTLAQFPPDAAPGLTDRLNEDLSLLRRASARQFERRKAQTSFDQLHLSLHGVIARSHGAHAVLNGTIVREGQVVPLATGLVTVERIFEDRVIVNYQGYRMKVSMTKME